MKNGVFAIVASAMLASSFPSVGQDHGAVPQGAGVSGSSWCAFATGKYPEFLSEVARLIELGGEVQGVYPYEQGQWRALVCKRGKLAN